MFTIDLIAILVSIFDFLPLVTLLPQAGPPLPPATACPPLAYAARVKAIALKSKALSSFSFKAGPMRYFAFTSDFGEAFRPAVPRWLAKTLVLR